MSVAENISTSKRSIRVLALDGGNFRGLSSLILLRVLMKIVTAKEHASATLRPSDYFDLIMGAGTGGLSALFVGRMQMTVDDAIDAYLRVGEQGFKRSLTPLLQRLRGKEALFDGDSLTRVIGDIVQEAVGDRDAQLQDARGVIGTRSDFCRTAVLATYSVYASAPPFVFRSYRTSIDPASTYSIHQAACATMATAGTFPPISIGSPPIAFIDAGVAGYNNPAEVALDEVTRIWPGAKITCLVSLGTGLQNIIRVGERSEDVTHVARRLMEDCEKVHDRIFQQFHRNRLGYYRFNVTTGLDGTDFREWDKETSGVIAGITEGYMRKPDVVVSLNACANILTGNAPDSISREGYEARSLALLNIIKDDTLAEKIIAWLNAPDSSQNYNDAFKKHHASTGSWFIDGKEFSTWKDGGRFLCIYGKPGCGKTVLCSTIITNVINTCKEKHSCALAYFFFDGRDAQSTLQLHDAFIRSLVRQFWAQYDGIPAPLVRLYGKGHQQPSTDALEEILQQICCGFTDSYIIIDSLDECAEREELLTWSTKTAYSKMGNLHLLATSRPEEDIKASLHPLMSIAMEDRAVNHDIEAYIDLKLNRRRLGAWPKEVRLHIKAILLEKAQGMFRWLAIQLDELQKCLNEAELDDQLKRLPKDLDETYFRILQRIPEQRRTAAKLFLQWTAFSARPPTLEELAEAGAMEPDKDSVPKYNARRKIIPRDVLTACASLLIESKSYVKLSHFSVKEYLLSDRISNTAAAFFRISERLSHSLISRTCLAYLLRFDSSPLVNDMLPTIPLAKYAAEHWVFHVRLGGNEKISETQNLIMALFGCGIPLTNWIRLYNYENPWQNPKYLNRITHTPNPLYYASLLGFTEISLQLLEKVPTPDAMSGWHINSPGGGYGTALLAACSVKHVKTVRMLLDHGADVDSDNGGPLRNASSRGHVEIVQMLLDCGADVNAQDGAALLNAWRNHHFLIFWILLDRGADINAGAGKALRNASSRGHVKIVRMLLDRGADVNAGDGDALWYASSNGHVEIVRMLLDSGADINTGDGKALRYALSNDHGEIVRMLLDRGADVNAGDGAALKNLSTYGQVETLRMLLDRGADVNARDGAALRIVSSSGRVDIARMLLDCGADVNAHNGAALENASTYGQVEIVRMLLDSGADMNTCDSKALCYASRNGHVEVVRMLLDCGADVNAGDGDALWSASSNGHVEIVRILLDSGADINTGDGNALWFASSNGHVEVVWMLLDRDADVNAGHGEALEDASAYGHVEIVRMLLDHGADVNARDGAALRIASSGGRVDVARILLDHGADINAGDGDALCSASSNGHVEIVRMLLDSGADIKTGDGNALWSASSNGHGEIFRMLRGADVNFCDGMALKAASRHRHDAAMKPSLEHGSFRCNLAPHLQNVLF